MTGRLGAGYFGILTEGFRSWSGEPRGDPAGHRHSWPESGPVLCQIRMINEYPLIPDLEAIEDLLEVALHGLDEPLI